MEILLRDSMPAFCSELEQLLEGMPDLRQQVKGLEVVARCTCGSPTCAHFYTAPRPSESYGYGHENICLNPNTGDVILDLVARVIVAVEVLDRPDVKVVLDRHLPLSSP